MWHLSESFWKKIELEKIRAKWNTGGARDQTEKKNQQPSDLGTELLSEWLTEWLIEFWLAGWYTVGIEFLLPMTLTLSIVAQSAYLVKSDDLYD